MPACHGAEPSFPPSFPDLAHPCALPHVFLALPALPPQPSAYAASEVLLNPFPPLSPSHTSHLAQRICAFLFSCPARSPARTPRARCARCSMTSPSSPRPPPPRPPPPSGRAPPPPPARAPRPRAAATRARCCAARARPTARAPRGQRCSRPRTATRAAAARTRVRCHVHGVVLRCAIDAARSCLCCLLSPSARGTDLRGTDPRASSVAPCMCCPDLGQPGKGRPSIQHPPYYGCAVLTLRFRVACTRRLPVAALRRCQQPEEQRRARGPGRQPHQPERGRRGRRLARERAGGGELLWWGCPGHV